MPGIWLGENTVPELTKIREGVLRFSPGTDRPLWPRLMFVGAIGIPCVVGCTFLAIYGESTINSIVMQIVLFAFSVTEVETVSSACWIAVASLIDTRSRTIARDYYFLGSRFWSKELQIHDGDFAQKLLVENRGNIGWRGILSAWSRFITRRT